jgi:hypothetical protein
MAEWAELRLVGVLEEERIEFRNCACGSTVAVELPGRLEKESKQHE